MRAEQLPSTRTHRQLAAWINVHVPALGATVAPSWSSTDQQLAGTRLLRSGKGRAGLRLTIKTRKHGTLLFEHDTSETYRCHVEAREWVQQWLADDLRLPHSMPVRWGTRIMYVRHLRTHQKVRAR